jgi:hypothetical protein
MQHLVTFSALVIAACAGFLTYWNVREHRNADLVKIGVSVLRVDPDKEKQISAARARVAESPASAFYEDTNDDEGPKDYQRKGGLAGARQATWQCEPGLQNARL